MSNISRSCKDCTLEMFIACSCYGDYKVLGTGTDTQLQLAWYQILSEYYVLTEDESAAHYLSLVKRMWEIQARRIYLDYCCHALELAYIPGIAKLLKKDFPMLKMKEGTYLEDLKTVRGADMRNKFDYDMLAKELETLEKRQNGKKSQRSDYIDVLLEINKTEHSSYTTTVSVEMFAMCIRRMKRKKPVKNGKH